MTITTALALIQGIIKAIPILQGWFDDLAAAYFNAQVSSMKAANVAAVKKAINDQDQRAAEKLLQSSLAGKVSGIPGTELRDSLPGVVQNPNPPGN